MTTETQFREMLIFYVLLRNVSKYLVTKQDRRCTYNVTLRSVRLTIVAAETQYLLNILSACP
jgi:hypothetical protein